MIESDTRDLRRFARFGGRRALSSRTVPGWLRLGVGTVVALSGLTSAWAQTPANEGADERAAQLFQEGNALYDQKRFADAEAKYESAWKLTKTFDLAANLGNVELLVDQPRDAAEHLAYAVKSLPLSATAEKKEWLSKRLLEAKAKVGTVSVRVNVANADVLVDGKSVGKSPLPGEVFVDPGKHAFEARLASYDGPAVMLDLGAGDVKEVPIDLKPSAGGQPTTPDGSTRPIWPYVALGGVAAAGLGVGLGFMFASNSAAKDRDAVGASLPPGDSVCGAGTLYPTECAQLEELDSDVDTRATVSAAGFVVGGAALVGLVVYAVWPRGRAVQASTGAQVAPLWSAGAKGITLQGSF